MKEAEVYMHVQFKLPEKMARKLTRLAEKEQRSKANMVSVLLQWALERREQNNEPA